MQERIKLQLQDENLKLQQNESNPAKDAAKIKGLGKKRAAIHSILSVFRLGKKKG